MTAQKEYTKKESSNIPCIEVLVSGNFNAIDSALHWTLSVYSLENRAVINDALTHAQIFHFMVFDWNRTIRELLDHHQVHYSILKYFGAESISEEFRAATSEQDFHSRSSASPYLDLPDRDHAASGELLPEAQ